MRLELQRKVEAHRGLPTPPLRRAIRVEAGLTQDDVAAELGVTRVAVARWELGERCPRDSNLVAYAELLRSLREVE